MKKRHILLVVPLSATFLLAACGGEEPVEEEPVEEGVEEEIPVEE